MDGVDRKVGVTAFLFEPASPQCCNSSIGHRGDFNERVNLPANVPLHCGRILKLY